MIHGIGTDIIEIFRIKESIDNYGDRFLKRIFTKNEIEYCDSKKNRYQHYAARFAAKESVFKALAPTLNTHFSWQLIEVINDKNGSPSIKLYGELERLVKGKTIKLSLSHSEKYSICFVIFFTP